MKASELRDIPEDTLREHIAVARRDLFGLRLQHATGELENTAGLRHAKRGTLWICRSAPVPIHRDRYLLPNLRRSDKRATAPPHSCECNPNTCFRSNNQ